MNSISDWACGLLEGEGSFFAYRRKDRPNRGLRVSCSMKDKDVMFRLYEDIGLGKMRLKNDGLWCWYTSTYADACRVGMAVYDRMGARRQGQIEHMLQQARPQDLEAANG